MFDVNLFTDEKLTGRSSEINFRAYRNIPYVKSPSVPDLQVLNIFIPAEYVSGGTINGYTAESAPIFFPNGIGGYMETKPCSPYVRDDGSFSTEAAALEHGYVVISAGARGRTTQQNGEYVGKAPACICDLKAAVRYVRSIADEICGDTNKIISNGTSAGGAMSALLGTSGNSYLFEPYLEEMGAEKGNDGIFAASCYCPITNLENSDMAYEWQYGHLSEQHWHKWEPEGDGFRITPMHTKLTDEQMKLSAELAKRFPDYLNSVKPNGLALDENGEGSFKEYVKKMVLKSAKSVGDVPEESGIDLGAGTVDFEQYCTYITRMKAPCAFDNPDMYTPENELFGSKSVNKRHFTDFGADFGGERVENERVKLMNAMNFVDNDGCAKYWRIRHGAADRDTSFAISAMLAECLAAKGKNVDYFLPWGVPHSGDYDLDKLFEWIDNISK